jgi:hypothetical protein
LIIKYILFALSIIIFSHDFFASTTEKPADFILKNAELYTMEPDHPRATVNRTTVKRIPKESSFETNVYPGDKKWDF